MLRNMLHPSGTPRAFQRKTLFFERPEEFQMMLHLVTYVTLKFLSFKDVKNQSFFKNHCKTDKMS